MLALMFVKAQKPFARVLIAFAIGSISLIGYMLKPTVLIAAVAIAAVGIAYIIVNAMHNRRVAPSKRSILINIGCVLAVVVGLAVVHFGAAKYIDSLGIIPYPYKSATENSMPFVHFLNIGMKYREYGGIPYYGGYNDQTAQTVAALPSKTQKTDYSINQIKQQLAAYGPLYYASFLAHKANWIVSDATFYAYGEGSNQNVVFSHSAPVAQWLRSFMYANGPWYILFANILQVFWIALLALIGVQVIVMLYSKSSRENLYILMPRIMLIGIMIFLLLFEGRSRYIFLYIPIFIIVAMYTLKWYLSQSAPALKRIGQRSES